jgi:hypothetical protein
MNKHWLLVGGVSFAMAGLGLGNLARAEDKDGKEEAEVKVPIKEVPSAVRKTLKRESHGADMKTVDKEEKDGKTVYEADAKIDGQNFEILISEDGTLISKLPDNEEDEKSAKHETKSRDGEEEERGEAKGRSEKEEHGKAKGREERDDEDRDEEHEGRGEERGHAGGASAKTVKRLLAQIHEVREELDKLEHQVKEMSGGRGGHEEKEEAKPSRGKHRAEAEEADDEKAEKQHEAKHHEKKHGDEEHED